MHKPFLIFILLLVGAVSFGQSSNYLVDIRVEYLQYKKDSVKFDKLKSIVIETPSCTEIFSLGRSRLYEFGMRVEILPSRLIGKAGYVIGKVYYVKEGNQWKEILLFPHSENEVKPIAQRPQKNNDYIFGAVSTSDPNYFEVRLNDDYYHK
jgi:hypothetical protein